MIPLRPLTVGEIFDGAIGYVRANPRATFGIAAIVGTVSVILQLAATIPIAGDLGSLQEWSQNPQTFDVSRFGPTIAQVLALSLVSGIITAILSLIASGVLTHVMGFAVQGKPMSLGEAWSAARPQLPRLVGASLIVGVAVSALAILPVLPGLVMILTSGGGSDRAAAGAGLMLLGLLAGAVLATFFAIRWSLTTPSLMLEGTTVTGALKRSWTLVGGAFWRTFGIILLGGIIASAVSGVVSGIFGAFGATGTTLALFMGSIGTVLGLMLAMPFIAGVVTLVYMDRRMRTEGFDAKLRAYTGT